MIGRFLEHFCQLLRFLVGALIVALLVPVAMQVVARYTGVIPVYLWTEELATFLFVWIIMLGSMIAVWEGTHFDVHVIPDAESPLGRLIQNGFVLVMVSLFAIFFTYHGINYVKFGSIQNSVMMRANLAVTYVTVPIAGAGWTMFALYRLYEVFAEYQAARKQTS